MVSLAVYRGRLHRVPEAPREWPMPPRKITLEQFRILTRKRDEAIARMAAANENPSPTDKKDDRRPKADEEEGEVKKSSDPQLIQAEGSPAAAKGAEDSEMIDANPKDQVNAAAAAAVKGSVMEAADVEMEAAADEKKMEISNNLNADKEKRRTEVEGKLEALKQKKHNLVQMLKQILNVEEEIKRRNAQSVASRFAVPLQAESAVDMGSATRHVPKLSVEVNFSGGMGAEMDATTNLATHGSRQLHHVCSTSPSAASLTRPIQQNSFNAGPRPTLVTSGHGQAPPTGLVGNTAAVSSSPFRFASTEHKGHHHSASLPPVSIPGANYMASYPSPAASGIASSVFRDSCHTSSS